MAKFRLTIGADFSADTVDTLVRQTLHKRQTNMKSSKAIQTESREAFTHEVDVELPDFEISRYDFLDWVLECCRAGYGGPPFVIAVDDLPDIAVVADAPIGVPT